MDIVQEELWVKELENDIVDLLNKEKTEQHDLIVQEGYLQKNLSTKLELLHKHWENQTSSLSAILKSHLEEMNTNPLLSCKEKQKKHASLNQLFRENRSRSYNEFQLQLQREYNETVKKIKKLRVELFHREKKDRERLINKLWLPYIENSTFYPDHRVQDEKVDATVSHEFEPVGKKNARLVGDIIAGKKGSQNLKILIEPLQSFSMSRKK